MLGVGDTAPEFEARDCQGRPVRLGDFRGRRLVLFFFPKAFTAGCTEEIRHFRDNQARIRELGGELVGVSVDKPEVQCEFARSENRVPAAGRQRAEDLREVRRPLAPGPHQPAGDVRGLAGGANRGGHPARAPGVAAPRRRHRRAREARRGPGPRVTLEASGWQRHRAALQRLGTVLRHQAPAVHRAARRLVERRRAARVHRPLRISVVVEPVSLEPPLGALRLPGVEPWPAGARRGGGTLGRGLGTGSSGSGGRRRRRARLMRAGRTTRGRGER